MLRKLLLVFFVLTLFAVSVMASTIIQAAETGTSINPADIIALLVPVVVWLASAFVNWFKAFLGSQGFSGTVLVTLVVPILSFGAAELYSYLAKPDLSFWVIFGLGLLGNFINEVVKQWSQTATKTQTAAKTKLIG